MLPEAHALSPWLAVSRPMTPSSGVPAPPGPGECGTVLIKEEGGEAAIWP